jgi:hypothetical protein
MLGSIKITTGKNKQWMAHATDNPMAILSVIACSVFMEFLS